MVIIWDFGGYGDLFKKNAIFSAALNVRGYRTHFILCDGLPETCIQRGIEKKEKQKNGKQLLQMSSHNEIQLKSVQSQYSTAKEYIDAINTEKLRKSAIQLIQMTFIITNTWELMWEYLPGVRW